MSPLPAGTPDRRTRTRRNDKVRTATVILLLILLEFYLIPSLVESRFAPDFLMIGMLLTVVRQPPGLAAATGFFIGLVLDTLTPARFGAAMLAHTLVGLAASWGRAVVFADNLVVAGGLFFVGTWARDVILLAASGTSFAQLGMEAAVWAPLHALLTAVAGIVIVLLFRDWLAIRIER